MYLLKARGTGYGNGNGNGNGTYAPHDAFTQLAFRLTVQEGD